MDSSKVGHFPVTSHRGKAEDLVNNQASQPNQPPEARRSKVVLNSKQTKVPQRVYRKTLPKKKVDIPHTGDTTESEDWKAIGALALRTGGYVKGQVKGPHPQEPQSVHYNTELERKAANPLSGGFTQGDWTLYPPYRIYRNTKLRKKAATPLSGETTGSEDRKILGKSIQCAKPPELIKGRIKDPSPQGSQRVHCIPEFKKKTVTPFSGETTKNTLRTPTRGPVETWLQNTASPEEDTVARSKKRRRPNSPSFEIFSPDLDREIFEDLSECRFRMFSPEKTNASSVDPVTPKTGKSSTGKLPSDAAWVRGRLHDFGMRQGDKKAFARYPKFKEKVLDILGGGRQSEAKVSSVEIFQDK